MIKINVISKKHIPEKNNMLAMFLKHQIIQLDLKPIVIKIKAITETLFDVDNKMEPHIKLLKL
ncbi:hypothetical protein RRG55_04100 [Mycoplasmopsis felis]|uniref:hypothetical protein n=1 Tax=Mycoplasmopsis felis TaxID=33923 RepID=UPI002AFEF6BB|nr:hypothetical protein [Mycoplasmopsis felis]WQQ04008.1 hypothetical protein RRG47_00350 [Mycoplasmopsis felis]